MAPEVPQTENANMAMHLVDLGMVLYYKTAQFAGAVEYIDCVSIVPNKCPGCDIKPSDGDSPVLELSHCSLVTLIPE